MFGLITYPEPHISNLSSLSRGPVLKSDYLKECKVVLALTLLNINSTQRIRVTTSLQPSSLAARPPAARWDAPLQASGSHSPPARRKG